MFTGIIEEIGMITNIKNGAKSSVLTIQGHVIFADLRIGDSVAVNGVCLTVSSFRNNSFTADVMHETLARSALGSLKNRSAVNLERAMPVNGRFGGHIVSGHIDGTGQIIKIEKEDNAIWYTINSDSTVMKYIVEKGSIAIDGISLTVAKVNPDSFSVSMIPHTASTTILIKKVLGDSVNLENDVIGKYVEKLLFHGNDPHTKTTHTITKEFLTKFGY